MESVTVDPGISFEDLPIPDELSGMFSWADGKRFDDGTLVIVVASGPGAYVYCSEDSDAARVKVDSRAPYRWQINEHWAGYIRREHPELEADYVLHGEDLKEFLPE